MRVEYAKCDACGQRCTADDASRGRYFELRAPFIAVGFDICGPCWRKMCAAVGLDPTLKTRDE